MPVKKTKKPRTRRAPAKKKGLKQKQKQKQQQKVNVQVSTGGGGGGTQFIPMPSAPVFDYAQLASLIRPANTVDVPIRAQANPEPLPARQAAAPSLKELSSKNLRFSDADTESESDVPFRTSKSASRPSSFYRSSGFIPPSGEGSGKKTKYETDIFGRDMPMTSSISASPSFEATGGGRKSSNIVSYLDLPSGGESEAFGRRPYDKMKSMTGGGRAGASFM